MIEDTCPICGKKVYTLGDPIIPRGSEDILQQACCFIIDNRHVRFKDGCILCFKLENLIIFVGGLYLRPGMVSVSIDNITCKFVHLLRKGYIT